MSAVNIPEAKNLLKPEQVTVQNLLIENGQLIETVAEYQRMGRIVEATKYQERLHTNLIFLAKLAGSTCSSHFLQEMGVASAQSHESPPPIELPPTVANSIVNLQQNTTVVTLSNPGVPCQQQGPTIVPAAISSHTSPPNGHVQQHGTLTPPAQVVQYQFPSPTQSSPHTQMEQQQQQQTPNATHHYSQQPTVPFQRNLNVPPHSMLFQHQQNTQLSHQQMGTQQHSVVYAPGHPIPTQHHQQYSSYPLLQQQSPHQFTPSIQSQFPSSTGAGYTPVVISTQSDSLAMGIRQQQQAYQSAHVNHSILQHGTSPGPYMAQQK